MLKIEKAFCCGSLLDKPGLCDCEKLYVSDSEYSKCPECGCYTYSYNDPAMDSSMSEWCTNVDCDYLNTQYMSWEDIKSDRERIRRNK